MALAAPLIARKRCVQVKLEATKGSAETSGMADLHCYDPKMKPDAQWNDRRGTSKYLGHTQSGVVGEQTGTFSCSFDVRGNGSNNWDAAVTVMLQGAGMLLTGAALTPVTAAASQQTVTIRLYEDGMVKILYGATGNINIEGVHGEKVTGTVDFKGYYAEDTTALPTWAPSATLPPILGTGSFTFGGESIKINKFGFSTGNDVQLRDGAGYFHIVDRDPSVNATMEADTPTGFDYYGIHTAQTATAIALSFGSGAGNAVSFAASYARIKSLDSTESKGVLMYDVGAVLVGDSGDDEYSWSVAAA